MAFNIRSAINGVVTSAEKSIGRKDIVLKKEVDATIPFLLHGNPLLLAHVLHSLLEDAIKRLIKGKITIKARVLNQGPTNGTVCFLVAFSGLEMCIGSGEEGEDAGRFDALNQLLKKNNSIIEELSCPGVGRQYRFFMTYEPVDEKEQVAGQRVPSLIEALSAIRRLLSPPLTKTDFIDT